MDKTVILESVEVGPLQVNCYVIGCSETKEAVILDPGGDCEKVKSLIDKLGVRPKAIILTHGHYDHIGCLDNFDLPVYIHAEDADMIKDGNKNLSAKFGTGMSFDPEIIHLSEGEVISFGKLELKVVHTPGHSMGSICILLKDMLFSGDTLFCRGIGRTDLPGGSFEQIRDSLTDKLLKPLPDYVKVFPGHGPATTIGEEKQGNVFL